MSKVDELINKSLDEIDEIVKSIGKGEADTEEDTTLEKGMSGDPKPDEVSEDTPPEENPEENPEEGNEEGALPSEEGNEETPEEGNEEEQENDTDEEEDNYEKSLKEELESDGNVRKAIEVSEFLTGFLNGVTKAMGAQRSEIAKSVKTSEESNDMLAKSFEAIAKSQRAVLEINAELVKSVRILSKKIKALEEQPMVRKSVASTNGVKVLEKSFNGQETKGETLSKSEIVNKLMSEYQSGKSDLMQDILAFESTGNSSVLSNTAKSLLNIK
jgi:hypothetical protein